MTQLLISVKNVQETLIALDAGVDLIDLKDPDTGALGALNLEVSVDILQTIQQYRQLNPAGYFPLTSATVGENYTNFAALQKAIQTRIKIGIDIIKITLSDSLKYDEAIISNFDLQQVNDLHQVKLIAVIFADQTVDLNVLQKLKKWFLWRDVRYAKQTAKLVGDMPITNFANVYTNVSKNGLKSGLAGSLKPQHIEQLVRINPSYIGFRGACANEVRTNVLIHHKVVNIKNMLQEHNRFTGMAQ